MLIGDLLLKANIKRILEEGFLDENPRPHYIDGTPAKDKIRLFYMRRIFVFYSLRNLSY